MRKTDLTLPIAVLPRTEPVLIEYAGDLTSVVQSTLDERGGVVLDRSVAEELGPMSTSTIPGASGGEIRVAGSFEWPDDGRLPSLSGAALSPVPANGRFDECWVRAWPPDEHLEPLYLLATDGALGAEPRTLPLNPTLGTGRPTSLLLENRATALVPWAPPLLALTIGFLAVWLRRVEIAGNLAAGARRTDVTLQAVIETIIWVIPALSAVAAIAYWQVVSAIAPGDAIVVFAEQLAPILAAGASAVFGTTLGTLTVRRAALYRYAKDR